MVQIQELDSTTKKAKTIIGNYKVDTPAVNDALNGNSKTSLGTDYLGNPVILSYFYKCQSDRISFTKCK